MKRSRAGRGRPEISPRRGSRWPAVLLTVGALALGAAAWWLAAHRLAPGRRAEPVTEAVPAPAASAPDTVALMDPYLAHDRAIDLAHEGRAGASLAYYGRAIGGLPEVKWLFRHDYSSALLNATGESQTRRGFVGPRTRGSDQRALYMRESLGQLDLAEAAATRAADKAFLRAARGHRFQTWGLPWDALEEFRAASRLDPAWREAAATARSYEERLRRPEAASR